MEDLKKRFFELANKKEKLDKERKEVQHELEKTMVELGVGSYLQDSDLTVYKIVNPIGTFIEYKKIGYERTAKFDESRGTLSKKEAEEQGFLTLKNTPKKVSE